MGAEPPPLPEGDRTPADPTPWQGPVPPPLPAVVPPPIPITTTSGQDPQFQGPPRPWGFWATVGWSALIFVGSMIVQGVAMVLTATLVLNTPLQKLQTAELDKNGLLVAVTTIFGVPVTCALTLFLAAQRRGMNVRDYLGLKWPSGKVVALWTLALIALLAIMDLSSLLMGRPIVPDWMVTVYRTAQFPPLLWLGIIVAAPLSEEFLFRGFAFEGLRQSSLGPAWTVVVTSAVWASLHMQYDLHGITAILLSGFLLGLARLKTGSLWLCVYLHALMNLVATIETIFHLNR